MKGGQGLRQDGKFMHVTAKMRQNEFIQVPFNTGGFNGYGGIPSPWEPVFQVTYRLKMPEGQNYRYKSVSTGWL